MTAQRPMSISQQAPRGSPNTPVTLRRVQITGMSPLSISRGAVSISDALIRTQPSGAPGDVNIGISIFGNDPGATLTLDRVTLIGSGGTALAVGSARLPEPTVLHARHLLVAGFETTLLHYDGPGDSTVRIEHSLVDTSSVIVDGDGRGTAVRDFATGNRTGDPGFANPAAGDYRITTGSAAIDIGGADLIAGEPTDLAGAPRPVDGDGDGVVANDAGAFEAALLERPVPIPAPPGGPPPGGQGPIADTTPPVISRPSLSARRFAVRRVRGARAPVGTTFRFSLSEVASLRIELQRKAPGRRVGGRCRRPSRTNRSGRRCTRWVAVGALTRADLAAGQRRIAFGGRVGRRALAAGSYRAILVATDAAGDRSQPRTLAFTVVRASARR